MAGRESLKLSSLVDLLQTILPPSERDVPFFYHLPRHLDIHNSVVGRLVLSIVPTKGVYESFTLPRGNGLDVYFLHRPWKLDRHRGAKIWRRPRIVLASHKVFDEVLTVGWNVALAKRLDLALTQAVCLRGYKNNPDRKIGLVAPFLDSPVRSSNTPATTSSVGRQNPLVLEQIKEQFGTIEKAVGFHEVELNSRDSAPQGDERIRVIAIMNAFSPVEVERIAAAALEAGFVESTRACEAVLCLTGEPREEGIEEAVEIGMKVVCVGHRACEDWGIRYLADQVQLNFPDLEIRIVDEPEEPEIRECKARGTDCSDETAGSTIPAEAR